MKLSRPLPLIILALAGFAIAEPPGSRGSPAPPASHAPAPVDPEASVRTTAAAFLSSFLKKQGDHHLCELRMSGSAIRIELSGLHLTRVTSLPVSPADHPNGITESRYVLIDYSGYRARSPRTAQWSAWSDSPNPLLPSAIRVEKGADGQWRANPKDFQLLTRLSTRADPAIIPHIAQPATAVHAAN